MTRRKRYAALAVLATAAVAGGILAGAEAGPSEPPVLTDVATANTRSDGYAPWSKLSVELRQVVVAQGSTRLDGGSASPSSVGYYGYDNDTLNAAGRPQMVPTPTTPTEARKTEPDKNTYVVFKNSLSGADPHYYYGTHFLFQGHELGSPGYITRINLDADADHRVTLLATKDVTGANLATIDGSTWEPWAERLLFTTENTNAPTYAATPGFPSTVTDVSGALGRGGYEGIQDDSDGNIDRRGHRRVEQTRHDRKDPQQLHLPLRPQDQGRSGEREAAGPAGAERRGQPDHQGLADDAGQLARPDRASRLRRELQDAVGDDPRHGRRRDSA